MNLIIAVVGDTYDRVLEEKDAEDQNWDAGNMSWTAWFQKSYSQEEQRNCRFLYFVEPISLNDGEAAEWEGKISKLRKHFDQAFLANNIQVSKRNKKLERKMDQMETKMMTEMRNMREFLQMNATQVQATGPGLPARSDQQQWLLQRSSGSDFRQQNQLAWPYSSFFESYSLTQADTLGMTSLVKEQD